MKKIIALTLAASLLLSGCSKNEEEDVVRKIDLVYPSGGAIEDIADWDIHNMTPEFQMCLHEYEDLLNYEPIFPSTWIEFIGGTHEVNQDLAYASMLHNAIYSLGLYYGDDFLRSNDGILNWKSHKELYEKMGVKQERDYNYFDFYGNYSGKLLSNSVGNLELYGEDLTQEEVSYLSNYLDTYEYPMKIRENMSGNYIYVFTSDMVAFDELAHSVNVKKFEEDTDGLFGTINLCIDFEKLYKHEHKVLRPEDVNMKFRDAPALFLKTLDEIPNLVDEIKEINQANWKNYLTSKGIEISEPREDAGNYEDVVKEVNDKLSLLWYVYIGCDTIDLLAEKNTVIQNGDKYIIQYSDKTQKITQW